MLHYQNRNHDLYAYRAVWIPRDIPDKANIRATITMENNAISCMIGVNFR